MCTQNMNTVPCTKQTLQLDKRLNFEGKDTVRQTNLKQHEMIIGFESIQTSPSTTEGKYLSQRHKDIII